MYNIGTSALKEQDYFKKIPIKGAGFTALHNQHIRQISKVIPNNCKLLYDILLSYSDKNRAKVWPGNDILCDHTGLSERTIRRQLSILEANGLIIRRRGKYGRREIHFNCLDSLINLVDSKTLQDNDIQSPAQQDNQLTIKDNGHNNLNLIEVEPVDKDVEERFEQNEKKLDQILKALNTPTMDEVIRSIHGEASGGDPFAHNSDRPNDFDQRLRILNLLGLEQQAEDLIKAYPQWTTISLLNKLNDYCQESTGLKDVPRYAVSRIKTGQITGIETKKDQSAKHQSERNDDIDRQAMEMRNKIKLFEVNKDKNQVSKLPKNAKKCMTCGSTMAWKANLLNSYYCIKCTPPLENGHSKGTYEAFALCDGPVVNDPVAKDQGNLFKKEESKSVPLNESDGYTKWEMNNETNGS